MSTPLTKAVIVESVQNQLGIPKKECVEMVETLLEIIKSSLASGEDVLISGFGKFSLKDKKARRVRNPATSEDLMLEPRRGQSMGMKEITYCGFSNQIGRN